MEDFAILINPLPMCDFAQDVILCSKSTDMNHNIKNVKSPLTKLDSVNKAYVEPINFKTT